MADIQVPQGRVFALTRQNSTGMYASQAQTLAVINFPTESMMTSQAGVQAAVEVEAPIDVSQAVVLAAVRGRVQNPSLRAWTYTLDGHDFYVLRLGDEKTLVYDLSTEQWSSFTSGAYNFWRANTGTNWRDALSTAHDYGSNIIVGDDTYGLLWFLDPDQGYDDQVNKSNETPKTFPRVATGQVTATGREYLPVFEVFLTGSNGYPSLSGGSVDLKYSDDAGNNYVSAGPIVVDTAGYNQDISWHSLGRFSYPGRLFRIEDDGAFARIDGLDVNHGAAAS